LIQLICISITNWWKKDYCSLLDWSPICNLFHHGAADLSSCLFTFSKQLEGALSKREQFILTIFYYKWVWFSHAFDTADQIYLDGQYYCILAILHSQTSAFRWSLWSCLVKTKRDVSLGVGSCFCTPLQLIKLII
jgi:hypothetical protein